MSGLESFFHMGGYGGYVWPSYALTLAVLIGIYAATARFLKRNEAALKALESDTDGNAP